ncbi:MAG: hypothetical protein EXR79_09330 [Myxococcales bacterium]|nr:hypothetical protein [Myxococcales bacterium]
MACGLTVACTAPPLPSTPAATDGIAIAADAAAGDAASSADSAGAASAGDSAASATADGAAKADAPTPDGAAPAPCKPWVQPDSCAAGTHCGYDEIDVMACIADGPHGAGEDCGDNKGCSIGMCITDTDSGAQRCAPHCATDVHCDSNQCGTVTGKKYKVCSLPKVAVPTCNPFTQNCTDKTKACVVKQDFPNGGCISKGGTAEKGDACEQSGNCKPLLYCAGAAAGGSGVCRTLCKTAGASGCEPVTVQCVPVQKGGAYGYCDG